MENKKLTSNVFSTSVMENMQTLSDMSIQFYSSMLENMIGNNTQMSQQVGQLGKNAMTPIKTLLNSEECCAPKQKCPPHCIASIERKAMPEERIVIPFIVKNTCQTEKHYQVGIRELKDQDGNLAVSQPSLNKSSVSLEPYVSERVLLTLDLSRFEDGIYTTEIVLREKEFNQNICLSITVGDYAAPIVSPYAEKTFKLKWQSWQSHYYCEPKKQRNQG